MTFVKGHKDATGRPKGAKNIKTLQWESIGDYLVEEGSDAFLKNLKIAADTDPEKYAEVFMKILEYFKPKLARSEVDHTTKGDKVQAVIILPPEKQNE